MWLPTDVISAVDAVARVHYVDVSMTARWNANRHESELRLLTGWCWTAKDGKSFRQGFKTMTIAYRDAWYSLVSKGSMPAIAAPRLRRVV